LRSSTTGEDRLPGARENLSQFSTGFDRARPNWLSVQSAAYLVQVYGTRAAKVVDLATREEALREVISPATGAIAATIVFSFSDEHASTLTDAMMRRSMIGYATDAGFDALDGVARAARIGLGWDETRISRERDEHLLYMKRFLPIAERKSGCAP
jgi:glycerol-3-phosphate dehydrogenase